MAETKAQEDPGRVGLPIGFSDQFGQDLQRQRLVEAIFTQEGFKRGYREIRTPVVEPLSALLSEAFSVLSEEAFFAFDLVDYGSDLNERGRTRVALRPEGTIPVCRFLADRVVRGADVPARLVYSISCYRNEPVDEVDEYKRREFSQLGVENIGNPSLDADLEVIEYGYSVLRKIGIPEEDIRIRISDISIFKELCAESGFEQEQQVALQRELDSFSKDRALGKAESNLAVLDRIDPPFREKWMRMFEAYGCPSGEMYNLYDLFKGLERAKVPYTIDLSVVRGFNYYTGPVFQYDVRSLKGKWLAEIGGGGRYDELIGQNLRRFGTDMKLPATGFAFGTERLVQASRLTKGVYTVEMII